MKPKTVPQADLLNAVDIYAAQLKPVLANINALAYQIEELGQIETPQRAVMEHILEPSLTRLHDAIRILYGIEDPPETKT